MRPSSNRGAGGRPDHLRAEIATPTLAADSAEVEVQVPAGATREGQALLASIMRGLVRCPLCARSVGVGRGRELCYRCALELKPTRVQFALATLPFTADEICSFARVSRRTLMSAARGIPIGLRSARRITDTLGLLLSDVALTERARGSSDV